MARGAVRLLVTQMATSAIKAFFNFNTVVLARAVVDERLSRTQMAGIACALVAVVTIVGTS